MQAALEDIIKDLQVLASDMQKWVVQSFNEGTPPASIADFPPPVIPEFGNCQGTDRKNREKKLRRYQKVTVLVCMDATYYEVLH